MLDCKKTADSSSFLLYFFILLNLLFYSVSWITFPAFRRDRVERMSKPQNGPLHKVIMVGHGGVGKSALKRLEMITSDICISFRISFYKQDFAFKYVTMNYFLTIYVSMKYKNFKWNDMSISFFLIYFEPLIDPTIYVRRVRRRLWTDKSRFLQKKRPFR